MEKKKVKEKQQAVKETGKEADEQVGEKESVFSGCRRELESLMVEYENQFDRSNKLDNKVYIAITFCGFLFVFITGLFSGISGISRPGSRLGLVVDMGYILSCIAVMVSYVYVLIFFMGLLRPEQIIRMDPEKLERAGLEQMGDLEACQCLVGLYRATINENLDKLKVRCDQFTRGLRFIVLTVLLAFTAYAFQIVLSVF